MVRFVIRFSSSDIRRLRLVVPLLLPLVLPSISPQFRDLISLFISFISASCTSCAARIKSIFSSIVSVLVDLVLRLISIFLLVGDKGECHFFNGVLFCRQFWFSMFSIYVHTCRCSVFFRFSSVVDAFHFLCGRFAVISLTLVILLHWFYVGAQVLHVCPAVRHSFAMINHFCIQKKSYLSEDI